MIIVKDKGKNSKIYIQRTGGDIVMNNNNTDIDLTDYYTKEEVDELIENVEVDLSDYATEQWVEDKGYLTTIPTEYVTENELSNKEYATETYVSEKITDVQEWIEQQGYLTSIPDDVVTEDELNDALENIDMSYPTLIINLANSTYEGDLDEVVTAIKNDEPVNVIVRKNNNTVYLATQYYVTSTYFRCYCRYWLSAGRLEETYVQITFDTNEVKKTTRETIGVVDELTSTDATSALSANMGRELKSMIDAIEVPSLEGYATETYVDTQIGNINNILENIIG